MSIDSDSPRRRTGRTVVRPETASARLMERDRWLLEALAKMRFLTTTQVAKLFFGASRAAANKRLRRLLDGGWVRAWVQSLSEDNVYSVTRATVNLLHEQNDDAAATVRVPRGLDPNLGHLLAINAVRIAFALDLGATGGQLSWWRSDWELRLPGRSRLVPDALFEVTWEDHIRAVYALELDRHTKTPQRFLKKILGYAAARFQANRVFGDDPVTILVVGAELRWVERYRAGVAHLRLHLPIWFAPLQAVTEDALGEIWLAATGDREYSLRALQTLPYGTHRGDGESNGLTPT